MASVADVLPLLCYEKYPHRSPTMGALRCPRASLLQAHDVRKRVLPVVDFVWDDTSLASVFLLLELNLDDARTKSEADRNGSQLCTTCFNFPTEHELFFTTHRTGTPLCELGSRYQSAKATACHDCGRKPSYSTQELTRGGVYWIPELIIDLHLRSPNSNLYMTALRRTVRATDGHGKSSIVDDH